MTNVIILGLPKSGTTIAAYRTLAGMPKPKRFHFEPTTFGHPGRPGKGFEFHRRLVENGVSNLSKCLVFPGHGRLDWQHVRSTAALYDRRVWICRDPRDLLLSEFFYRFSRSHLRKDMTEQQKARIQKLFDAMRELVQRKESNPQAVSILSEEFAGLIRKQDPFNKLVDLIELDDSWHVIRYEDFIRGEVGPLERYLGFPIDMAATIDRKLAHVSRTLTYDNWRSWFIESDLPFLEGVCLRYMERFGYDTSDWKLEAVSSLSAEHGSAYMQKIFDGAGGPGTRSSGRPWWRIW